MLRSSRSRWPRLDLLALALVLLTGCARLSAHGKRAETRTSGAATPACVPGLTKQPIRLAVTIDDLPGSTLPSTGWPKSRVMGALIDTLKAHRVPGPVGFVNGIYAEGDPDAEAGLSAWLAAGYEVANHTYSHQSANALEPAAFLADVQRNRDWLAARLSPAQPALRYFRYPFLERGQGAAQRALVRRGLTEQGYRVVDVSVDFADWAYSDAYARCLAKADATALEALATEYLQHAVASLFWSVESAQQVFGRPAPHVLLLHAIVPTALNLDALLRAYEEAGVELISLEEALADPAYAEPAQLDHHDASLVWEAAHQRGVPLRSYVPWPTHLLSLACR